jgi:CHASE1-domain containing sensor protein
MARSIFLLFCIIIICLSTLVIAGVIENNQLTQQVKQDRIIIDSLEKQVNVRH